MSNHETVAQMSHTPVEPGPDEGPRYTVKVPDIHVNVPPRCVRCLSEDIPFSRPQVYRRSDKTVERIVAAQWPYCPACYARLKPLKQTQRLMTVVGVAQMLLILYGIGASMGEYDLWYPSLGILAVLVFVFGRITRRARKLKWLEWAHIHEVYKGGVGSSFRLRNRDYAELFAAANVHPVAEEEAPTEMAS